MVSFPSRRGPRPSSAPPPAKRLPTIGGDRPPPPLRKRRRGETLERGRVVSVFGPPGVGVSTCLRILHEESTTPTGLVLVVDESRDEIERRVLELQRKVEVVLLDGLPRDNVDVQWLYDRRFVSPAGGTLVRLARNAVLDVAWETKLPWLVQAIMDLSLPYKVVLADDPVVAATAVFNVAELE